MRWARKLSNTIKKGIRSWLQVQEASPTQIMIQEKLDYELNAIKNRIWYRGDSDELQQLYGQIQTGVDRYKFWASNSTPGMEIRKIHTGLPSLIIDTLASVTLNDLEIKIEKSGVVSNLWEEIDKENKVMKKLEKAVKETLYIGDGAFKITFDTDISKYPILEFYPGDRIELVIERGRTREIIFKTVYEHGYKQYILHEHYGYGYIKYELCEDDKVVELNSIPQTENLIDLAFSTYREDKEGKALNRGSYMMAVPIQFYESGKWDGRGQSILDKKVDAFDAFDEAWSQWMDSLRAGRSKEYIPECLIPRNPTTGEILKPNHFDNRYIKIDTDMSEKSQNKIDVEQPEIPHESYLATYVTALDLCLQGIISPSTLGIDVKKLDNADAQREKEKATLYTRDAIIKALQKDVPELVEITIKSYNEFNSLKSEVEAEITAEFGDYANPSFESQVETIGKAKTQGIMSIDATVDELYGDSKEEEWKQEEIARLKKEQGIEIVDEPSITGTDILELPSTNPMVEVGE